MVKSSCGYRAALLATTVIAGSLGAAKAGPVTFVGAEEAGTQNGGKAAVTFDGGLGPFSEGLGTAAHTSIALASGAVPPPSNWGMFGLGFASLSMVGYRKRRLPRVMPD